MSVMSQVDRAHASPAEEFVERKRRGEHPSLSEYTDLYPELADEILKALGYDGKEEVSSPEGGLK